MSSRPRAASTPSPHRSTPDARTGLQTYLRLLSYVKPYWLIFIVATLGLWLFGAMQVAAVDLLGYLIDALTKVTGEQVDVASLGLGEKLSKPDASLTGWVAQALLADGDVLAQSRVAIPVMLIGMALVRGIGFLVGNYGMSYISQGIVLRLRGLVFAKLTRMPSAYFDGQMTGHLVTRLTFHIQQLMGATTTALKVAIREGSLVIGLMAYLVYLNWKLALIFFTIAPFIALIVGTVSRRLRRISKNIQSAMGQVTQVAQEAVSGYREMYLFGGQEYEKARMWKASNNNRRQSLKLAATSGMSTPLVQILVSIAMSVLIWLTLTPEILATMTAGGFAKFIFTAALMGKPLRQRTQINEQVQQGIAAADTLFATLDDVEEIDDGTLERDRVEGHFEFRGISFSYGKRAEPVLNDISFTVAAGDTIALVGSSGSGKSTLVSLIPRFYNHAEGQILLDGVDVNDYRLVNLRKHIALVSQQVTLFNDSVYRNIAYGELAGCSREQVREAARMAHALNFIEALPQGFDTLIGDDGVMLSGGQRQRLAIARALLKDAPILILDEATSALDTESERYIQAALEVAMKGRTPFVIAHRLSTVENAARILVLEAGRLVEMGSHRELLAAGGRYAELYQTHFLPAADPDTAAVASPVAARARRDLGACRT